MAPRRVHTKHGVAHIWREVPNMDTDKQTLFMAVVTY